MDSTYKLCNSKFNPPNNFLLILNFGTSGEKKTTLVYCGIYFGVIPGCGQISLLRIYSWIALGSITELRFDHWSETYRHMLCTLYYHSAPTIEILSHYLFSN